MSDEEPEAYRLGWIPFLGLDIWLDSKPLIPRTETEWWTDEMLREVGSRLEGRSAGPVTPDRGPANFPAGKLCVPREADTHFSFLDLCAGSGAIGCAVLKNIPNAQVYFGEIDPAHEATIRKNMRENHLDESRADIRIGDLFAPFGDMQFDLIAANPPYVPESRELPPSVADYEPALALRAGPDGLALIRRIAAELPHRLNPGGQAWVECDSAHAAEACALFSSFGMRAEIRNDQFDVPRFLVVSFPL